MNKNSKTTNVTKTIKKEIEVVEPADQVVKESSSESAPLPSGVESKSSTNNAIKEKKKKDKDCSKFPVSSNGVPAGANGPIVPSFAQTQARNETELSPLNATKSSSNTTVIESNGAVTSIEANGTQVTTDQNGT